MNFAKIKTFAVIFRNQRRFGVFSHRSGIQTERLASGPRALTGTADRALARMETDVRASPVRSEKNGLKRLACA
jgi:hypothetical protein